eukprot:6136764-Pyramimonas_sp.AAC.1
MTAKQRCPGPTSSTTCGTSSSGRTTARSQVRKDPSGYSPYWLEPGADSPSTRWDNGATRGLPSGTQR